MNFMFPNYYPAFNLCEFGDILNFRKNSHSSLLTLHLSSILYYFVASDQITNPRYSSKIYDDLIVDDVKKNPCKKYHYLYNILVIS